MKSSKKIELIAPNQAEINRKLYAKAPTYSEIAAFLKAVGLNPTQYERVIGMSSGTIANAKCGFRALPAKYWMLVYQRIVPTYSHLSGFKKPKINTNKTFNKPLPTPNQSTLLTSHLSLLTR